jgi:hypothetical protein
LVPEAQSIQTAVILFSLPLLLQAVAKAVTLLLPTRMAAMAVLAAVLAITMVTQEPAQPIKDMAVEIEITVDQIRDMAVEPVEVLHLLVVMRLPRMAEQVVLE